METQVKPVIKIDVVSDVVCPWCYIGKRRLEKAVDELSGVYTFEITYHPFELNPSTPVAGVNQRNHLADKFGGDEQYEKITAHTTAVAAGEGLDFNFDKQHVLPNTRKAHALIQGSLESGSQLAVTEALFKAYFTEGRDLSKDCALIEIAVGAGLEASIATAMITDNTSVAQVALAEQSLQKLGIRGVPFYIVNDAYGISGAQASETFVKAFRELSPLPEANVCQVDEKC